MTYQYHDALDRFEAKQRAEQFEREHRCNRECDYQVTEVGTSIEILMESLIKEYRKSGRR